MGYGTLSIGEDGVWGEVEGLDPCLFSTVRFFVLINASPSSFFNSSRGLRLGDSLSHLLFVLVMEVFSRMLKKTMRGFIDTFRIWHAIIAGLHISHLYLLR